MEQDSLRTARRLHHIRGENIVRNEYPPTPELERFRMDETEIQLKTVRHYERRNKEKMVERRLPKLKMKERISRNELLMEEMSVSNGPVYQRNGKPVYGVLPPISKTSSIRNEPNKSVGRTSRISLDIRSNETITYPHDGNSATNGPTINENSLQFFIVQYFHISITYLSVPTNYQCKFKYIPYRNCEFNEFRRYEYDYSPTNNSHYQNEIYRASTFFSTNHKLIRSNHNKDKQHIFDDEKRCRHFKSAKKKDENIRQCYNTSTTSITESTTETSNFWYLL
ncbi:hypothetical protein SNEBB_008257 [Seison nebaliae]|nr:hypothetical protein SNEBB_008257 [Seison nebaliae]